MAVSRVNVAMIGVASVVELGFLVGMELTSSVGGFELQRVLETLPVVLVPLILILLPSVIYRTRATLLPLSGATLVYLFTGVSMGFTALAMGPHYGGAAMFLGLIVQVLTAGANFLGALEIEA